MMGKIRFYKFKSESKQNSFSRYLNTKAKPIKNSKSTHKTKFYKIHKIFIINLSNANPLELA